MSLTNDLQTELALRARDDSKALTELIIDCSGSVWTFIHKRMSGRSEEDKEDVYQDIMFHLHCSISSFKGKSSFFTWFRRMWINKVADYYRKDSRDRVFLMKDPNDWPSETTKPEWYNVYDEYKELLPEHHYHYLDVIYDLSVNGYTLSEVAEFHGKSYEAIRSRRNRGKIALKEDLEEQGVTYRERIYYG